MNNDVPEIQQTKALEYDNTMGPLRDQGDTQAVVPWPAQQQNPQTQQKVNKKEQKNQRSEDEIAEEERNRKLKEDIVQLNKTVLDLQNIINKGETHRVAKMKQVETPTFNGDRAVYVSWKNTMKAYLTSTETPAKFRGHFIFESLRGDPKEYIGEGVMVG